MAVAEQVLTDRYALYQGDCLEVMPGLKAGSVHLSVYSPPFCGLYHYSSSPRDLSNCRDYGEFFKHYELVVKEIARLTMPGRMSLVHCMDLPTGNSGTDHYTDFPGDIIRLHEKHGMRQASPRINIWKEPLSVRNRTLTKALAHKSIVVDSCSCAVAGADYLLVFRKKGKNAVPVTHEHGITRYAGERHIPPELLRYKGWTGKQTENRYSHWIWRQYASAFWDDIRGNTGTRTTGVLPHKAARDEEDEKHLHPLQLDVIDRCMELWSNPGETVFTPFMGVGSEVFAAVRSGRRGIGVELKPSYYRQAVANIEKAQREGAEELEQADMFADEVPDEEEATA